MKNTSSINSTFFAFTFSLLFAINAFSQFGTTDTTFGNNGQVLFHHSGATPSAVLRQSDGKIIAAGTHSVYGSNPSFTLVIRRYTANGSLDTSFGSNGTAVPYNPTGVALHAALQSDGKIVIAGKIPGPYPSNVYVWRFNANGLHDSGFGTNGRAFVGTSTSFRLTLSMFKTSSSTAAPESILIGYNDDKIKKLNSNGSINTSFGQGGMISGQGSVFVSQNATLFQDANIVAAQLYSNSIIILRGFNAAGQTNAAFGGNGQTFSYYGALDDPSFIYRMIRTGTGKIVVQGIYCLEGFQGCLKMPAFIGSHSASGVLENTNIGNEFMSQAIRSNPDGTIVTSRGPFPGIYVKLSSNLVTVEEAPGFVCHDLLIQPDTKIVCAADGAVRRFLQ